MTQAPLYWIKQLESVVIDTKAIPLCGYSPAFPWEELSKRVGSLFQCPDLTIRLKSQKILPAEELSQGFGTAYIPLTLELTPLQGHCFFLLGQEEISQLTSLALNPSHLNKGFLSTSFKEGFYYYLCTEVIQALDELKAWGDLSLKIGKTLPLPPEESLCIDIEILHPKHVFFGRVVCPAAFLEAFKAHFQQKPPLPLHGPRAQQIELHPSVTIGESSLTMTDYQQIQVGDFLILDRCTFDPTTKKGTALLCLEGTPILRLRMKEDHLKIVNYATYREEPHLMDPNHTPDGNENEEFSSPELEEDNQNDHLWSTEATTPDTQEEPLVSAAQIPLTLTVEVGKIQMSLEELINLAPGNTLELSMKPEQGVALTIQGKKVAKGELIKLGDVLGVKILQLA